MANGWARSWAGCGQISTLLASFWGSRREVPLSHPKLGAACVAGGCWDEALSRWPSGSGGGGPDPEGGSAASWESQARAQDVCVRVRVCAHVCRYGHKHVVDLYTRRLTILYLKPGGPERSRSGSFRVSDCFVLFPLSFPNPQI